MSVNNYKYITGAATTTFASLETNRVLLTSININKALAGTLTVKAGGGAGTTIGVFPIATPISQYWFTDEGLEVESLAMINSAGEDITVFYRNI